MSKVETNFVTNFRAQQDKLTRISEHLGGFEYKHIFAQSIEDAHWQLGEYMKDDIRRILDKKTKSVSPDELMDQIVFVRKCRQFMADKMTDASVKPIIKTAFQEYFDSLSAWAKGADLDSYAKDAGLKGISGEDLAWLMQNDNVGCQTAMIFDGKDVYALHVEEDDEKRIKHPQLISFHIGSGKTAEHLHFMAYPDLLFGSAFGWRKDFAQFIDFLYLNNPDHAGSLANTATWMTLRLGNSVNPKEVIDFLMPFADGYAFNYARVVDGKVTGEKYEVAQDQIRYTAQPQTKGSILYQNNIVYQPNTEMAAHLDPPKDQREFVKRRLRIEKAVNIVNGLKWTRKINFPKLLKVFSFVAGGDYAVASPRAKAHVGLHISEDGIDAYLGAGPGIRTELRDIDKRSVENKMKTTTDTGKIYFL